MIMKNTTNNYLSEFEQEFELDDSTEMEWESDDSEYEYEDDSEYEYDNVDSEYESDDREWESDAYEYEPAQESGYSNGYGRDREFEARLYEALNTHRDNEFEAEMEVERVLHEMEQEYFFGALKNLAKKHGGGLLKRVVGGDPMGLASKLFSKKSRGFLRGLLKNKWVQKAASFIPGAGPIVSQAMDVVGRLGDSEAPGMVSRKDIRETVQTAKTAYQNLAKNLTQLRPGSTPEQLAKRVPVIYKQAVQRHSNAAGKKRQIIPRAPGSTVVVYPDKIILYS